MDEGMPKKTHWGRWTVVGVAMLLIVPTLLWGDKGWFPTVLSNWTTLRFGVLVGVFMLIMLGLFVFGWDAVVYRTGRLTLTNGHFPYNENDGVEPAGDFDLVRTFGVLVPDWGISIGGRGPTLVVLRDLWIPGFERNFPIAGPYRWTSFNKLPPEVREIARAKEIPGPYAVVTHRTAMETRGRGSLQRYMEMAGEFLRRNTAEDLIREMTDRNAHQLREARAQLDDLRRERGGDSVLDKLRNFGTTPEEHDEDLDGPMARDNP